MTSWPRGCDNAVHNDLCNFYPLPVPVKTKNTDRSPYKYPRSYFFQKIMSRAYRSECVVSEESAGSFLELLPSGTPVYYYDQQGEEHVSNCVINAGLM